jgi:hypothetical protein
VIVGEAQVAWLKRDVVEEILNSLLSLDVDNKVLARRNSYLKAEPT